MIGCEVGIEPVDRLGQHRMAEAIDGVRKLGHDRWIHRRVEAVRHQEGVDGSARSCARIPRTPGADTASRYRTSPPGTGARRPTPAHRSALQCSGHVATSTASHSFRNATASAWWRRSATLPAHRPPHFLGVLDQAIVLRVEDVMDGSEADILVHPAVAGHEVRGRAVRCRSSRRSVSRRHCRGRSRCHHPRARSGTALCAMSARNACWCGSLADQADSQPAIRRRIALDNDVIGGIGYPVSPDVGMAAENRSDPR